MCFLYAENYTIGESGKNLDIELGMQCRTYTRPHMLRVRRKQTKNISS